MDCTARVCLDGDDVSLPGLRKRRPGILTALRRVIATRRQRAYTRRLLAELDGHILRDIGLNPWDAAREATRPFWQK